MSDLTPAVRLRSCLNVRPDPGFVMEIRVVDQKKRAAVRLVLSDAHHHDSGA